MAQDRTLVGVDRSGSGIGHATAVRLAAEGARVIAVDVSRDRLRNVEAELGDRVVAIDGDIVDRLTIDRATAAAEALAAAITRLLSDDDADASGAILPVDGGWAAI